MSGKEAKTSKGPPVVEVPSPSRIGKQEIYTRKVVERRREKTAMWLSVVTVGVFAFTILAALGALLWVEESRLSELIEFVKILLPAETALLGTAFGFYFSQTRLKDGD